MPRNSLYFSVRKHWRRERGGADKERNDLAINGIILNTRDITESVNYTKAVEQQISTVREIAWIQSHIVRAPLSVLWD
ncbi:MAG: hypothetical protein WBJ10_11320 [Daejeonella sp.]|uniref:hypothetical protein n=1 Tax=Daejeonella sp. TaxID=2805397 RepID=UPI003C70FB23